MKGAGGRGPCQSALRLCPSPFAPRRRRRAPRQPIRQRRGSVVMPPGNETVVDSSPAWISQEFLTSALASKGGLDVTVLSWQIEPATSKGDNFLSSLYRVRVEYKEAAEAPTQHLRIVVKCLPQTGDFLKTFIQQAGIFVREIKAYKDALPLMHRFGMERLPTVYATPFEPRYLHTTRPSTILLEDLLQFGFKMASRRDMLDLVHCRFVLKKLAHFHAVSFALLQHDPTFIDSFEELYDEKNRRLMESFLVPQMKCLADIMETWPNFEHIVTKIRKQIPGAVDKLLKVCQKQNSAWIVLTHGDCWVNNILFLYNESGEIVDLRFIDFQLTRFASPACDLTYLLYTSLQNSSRVEHMDSLIEYYHAEFASTVAALGCRGPVFTLKDLQEEMERVLFFAFSSSVGTLATALAEPDDSMDLSDIPTELLSANIEAAHFVKLLSSRKLREALQQMLPYFDRMKVFD